MGERHAQPASDPEELRLFTRRLLRDVKALETMLEGDLIESGIRRIGAEQEMFLVDEEGRPAPLAREVLKRTEDPRIVPELGLFNLEFNTHPVRFERDCLRRLEADVEALLAETREVVRECGGRVVLIGILPTLRKSDLDEENMTPEERYHALNDALSRLGGGAYNFYIKGTDELRVQHETMMLEACNASFQVHFQVGPQEFAKLYNIALVATAPVLAAAVNSPLLFGRRLWRETRIALFQQSIDTRSALSDLREIHPRVSFGSRWVESSILDIYREDIARFQVLLGSEADEDPLEAVERGEAPRLSALTLFNSTVYRWNRPCYGVKDGVAHLRVENRVLPSGPTVVDEIANGAFWFGLVNGLAQRHDDVREVIRFDDAKANFVAAARLGLGAPLTWLEGEESGARELILWRLIPLAREGLEEAGVDERDIDRYLGVIEARADSRLTGASWQLRSLGEMQDEGSLEQRLAALVAASARRQVAGSPVHEWEMACLDEGASWQSSHQRVEQYMNTDLVTVARDAPLDLVANLMDWNHVRHVPVEDERHRLLGIITRRVLLRFMATDEYRSRAEPISAEELMQRKLITAPPDMGTLEAIDLMRHHGISCLPIVRDETLVGIVTETDFMNIARELLDEKLGQGEGAAGAQSA
ncbi:MAG: glutamate-cysteine ligase family protein [Gemmatimonadota bacterium]